MVLEGLAARILGLMKARKVLKLLKLKRAAQPGRRVWIFSSYPLCIYFMSHPLPVSEYRHRHNFKNSLKFSLVF